MKDRDFVESVDGMFFCIVGYLHPPHGYTAYLKYVPSSQGKWRRNKMGYSRVLDYYHVTQMENTYEFLNEHFPEYLFFCPVRNIRVSTVPIGKVKTKYVAEEGLRKIYSEAPRDHLHKTLNDFVDYLLDNTVLSIHELGLTGSILTGMYNPAFSDIDLTVHGRKASLAARDFLLSERKVEGRISISDRQNEREWVRVHSKRFHLTGKDVKSLTERRWNYGLFNGRYFSVHPIRSTDEIKERYGDYTYRKKELVTGTAEISCARDSFFLPAVYGLTNVSSNSDADIAQLISYEVFYSGVFDEGDVISFHGVLEEVSGERVFHQVLVGGAGYGKAYVKFSLNP